MNLEKQLLDNFFSRKEDLMRYFDLASKRKDFNIELLSILDKRDEQWAFSQYDDEPSDYYLEIENEQKRYLGYFTDLKKCTIIKNKFIGVLYKVEDSDALFSCTKGLVLFVLDKNKQTDLGCSFFLASQ